MKLNIGLSYWLSPNKEESSELNIEILAESDHSVYGRVVYSGYDPTGKKVKAPYRPEEIAKFEPYLYNYYEIKKDKLIYKNSYHDTVHFIVNHKNDLIKLDPTKKSFKRMISGIVRYSEKSGEISLSEIL